MRRVVDEFNETLLRRFVGQVLDVLARHRAGTGQRRHRLRPLDLERTHEPEDAAAGRRHRPHFLARRPQPEEGGRDFQRQAQHGVTRLAPDGIRGLAHFRPLSLCH